MLGMAAAITTIVQGGRKDGGIRVRVTHPTKVSEVIRA